MVRLPFGLLIFLFLASVSSLDAWCDVKPIHPEGHDKKAAVQLDLLFSDKILGDRMTRRGVGVKISTPVGPAF